MRRNLFYILLAVALLLVCGIAQFLLWSDIYGSEGIIATGMVSLIKEDAASAHAAVEIQEESKDNINALPSGAAKNMDKPPRCGDGICQLDEFNYNCPEDC